MTDFLTDLGRELDRAAERLDSGRARRRVPRAAIALAAATAFAGGAIVLVDGDAPPRERAVPAITPTATPKPSRADRLATYFRFSPEEALAKIDAFLAVPVAVPAALPDGTGAHAELSNVRGRRRAYMALRLPDRTAFQIQYGGSGFDGCGPLEQPAPVDVNGERGLVYERRAQLGGKKPGPLLTTLIWPVREGALEGTYGISGEMDAERALALARSMDLSADPPDRAPSGC